MQRREVSMLSTGRDTLEGDVLEDELEDLHAGLALFRHDHHTHDLPGRMHGQGLLNGSGYAHRQGQDGPAFQTEAEATDSSARGSGRLIIVVTDSVLCKDRNGQVQRKDRTDPLFSVALAVGEQALGGDRTTGNGNGGTSSEAVQVVHWVCPADADTQGITSGAPPTRTSYSGSIEADPQLSPSLGEALQVSTVDVPAHVKALWLGEYVQLLLWPCIHSLLQPTGGGGLPPFGEPHALASAWSATQQGTQAFAKRIAAIATPQDTILIADPALLLLPEALRTELCLSSGQDSSCSSAQINPAGNNAMPNIVLAMRTSFPSPEVWRCLPQRAELLRGMLGADLIVLQSFEDARNISASAQHVLGLEARPSWVDIQGRFAALSVMPLGIEPAAFSFNSAEVQRIASSMRQHLQVGGPSPVPSAPPSTAQSGATAASERAGPAQKIILAIDSLDMSRGIPQKLLGFETLLTTHSEYKEQVTFVLVLNNEPDSKPLVLEQQEQPSRRPYPIQQADDIDRAPRRTRHSYSFSGTELGATTSTDVVLESSLQQAGQGGSFGFTPMTSSDFQTATLRKTVHELVGRINGAFATATWLPIRLLSATLTTHQRAALYSLASVGFQVSAREGLTYEALEYIAAQDTQNPGVLLYSDFAGAAGALRGAITVNPFDASGVGQALHKALSIPNKQRQLRAAQVLEYVQATSASVWAARMLVLASAAGQAARDRRAAQPLPLTDLQAAYRAVGPQKGRRLLVFSYNGTLRPYASSPEQAGPSARLRMLLATLASDPLNTVWVISGDTTAADMHSWMGDLPIGLAAESGYLYRYPPSQPLASSLARGILSGSRAISGPGAPSADASKAAVTWAPAHPSIWQTLFQQPGQNSRASMRERQAGGQPSSESSAVTAASYRAPEGMPELAWYEPVRETFQFFTDRVPGTRLQAQEATLVWSYADAQPDSSFGDAVSRDVLVHLDSILFGQPAEALPAHAKRFIAVRPVGLSKGALLARLLSASDEAAQGPAGSSPTAQRVQERLASVPSSSSSPYTFIMVAGDERTDEEMYPHARRMNAQPGCSGWAVLVQPFPGAPIPAWNDSAGAPYYVHGSDQLLSALDSLTETLRTVSGAGLIGSRPLPKAQAPVV